MTDGDYSESEGVGDNTKGHSQYEDTPKNIITPFPCTYQRGSRHVFAASKRQETLSPTSTPGLDKGKEEVGKVRRIK